VVRDAKKRFRDRVEMQMEQRNTRHIWQGLWTITDYRGRTPSTVSDDASLADDHSTHSMLVSRLATTPLAGP